MSYLFPCCHTLEGVGGRVKTSYGEDIFGAGMIGGIGMDDKELERLNGRCFKVIGSNLVAAVALDTLDIFHCEFVFTLAIDDVPDSCQFLGMQIVFPIL